MIKFWLLLFSFYPLLASAQQQQVDSLLQELATHPYEDSTRFLILNDLAYNYYAINPDSGLLMADKAIALATALNKPDLIASSYANKATNYWAKGEDSLSMAMQKFALDFYEKNGNRVGMGRMYNNIGLSFFNQSDYRQAISYHRKGLEIFTEMKDSNRVAILNTNLAVDYQYISDYPLALKHHLQAIHFYENNEDKQGYGNGLANAYNSTGLVYKTIGQYQTALSYYDKAQKIYERLNNKTGLAGLYGNYGVVYNMLAEYNKAIDYYQKSLKLNTVIGSRRLIGSNLSNLADTYITLGKYDTAYQFLQKSLSIYDTLGDKKNQSIVLSQIGVLLTDAPAKSLAEIGINVQNKYAQVLQYQFKSLKLAEEIGAITQQSTVTEYISNAYEKSGNTARALHWYKQHTQLKDSALNDSKKTEIAKLEASFEYQQKEAHLAAAHEKQVAIAEAKLQKQRLIKNSAIAGILLLVIASAGGYMLYKKKRDAEILQKQTELKAQVTETEMKALRAQMNPHFIFNSLNSITDFISKNNIAEADQYLTKFAKLIRMILENSGKKQVSLHDDLQALKMYMDLEAKRLNKPFSYQIFIDPEIDANNTMVPPLLLQPFVENSIWHGISNLNKEGKINVRITKNGDLLNCIIEDNGVGRQASAKLKTGTAGKDSLGMKITKERIDIINIVEQRFANLHLTDLAQGLRAEINLPFETAF